MGWSQMFGWIVFLTVPGLLWLAGAIANRGGDIRDRLLGFTVGTDGRLSLSRLQAFLWTLVIFGSFAAAMGIHKRIVPGSPAESKKATDDAQSAKSKAATAKSEYDKAIEAAKARAAERKVADLAAEKDEASAQSRAHDPNATQEQIASDKKKASDSRATAAGVDKVASEAEQTVADAKATWVKAEGEAKTAETLAMSFDWVKIPDALLVLAGIAISSGVFSSLIAAVTGEDKTAKIVKIRSISKANAKAQAPDVDLPANAGDPKNSNYLVLDGSDLGDSGMVRFARKGIGKDVAPVLHWKTDGTQIVLDVADGKTYSRLIVDTPNGKLCYELNGQSPNLVLGVPKSHYEFADLFRDDKHPGGMDLMKFQMFGWTVIAVFIYVWLFLSNLSDQIVTLPNLDSSIVILTGVSQAGI